MPGTNFQPQARSGLEATSTALGVFQAEFVIYRLAEFLLAPNITLSCLNRCMPKQELNLFKFSAGQVA